MNELIKYLKPRAISFPIMDADYSPIRSSIFEYAERIDDILFIITIKYTYQYDSSSRIEYKFNGWDIATTKKIFSIIVDNAEDLLVLVKNNFEREYQNAKAA